MVNRRLQALLESRTFYSPVQSGFRAGHSTLDCLSRLEHDARMALLRKHYCVAVFLDIERAFDTVWHHGLLQKLSSLGISGNMANFLQGFLTRRTTRVKIGSHLSTSHNLVCGVPQGSVLSPTLFTIYLNDLFATLPENVNSSLYADDGALWTTSASLPEAVSRLQLALDRITEWSHTWGLSVSPTKTNAIIFTLCRPPSPPPLFLSNSPLSYVSHVRFLGLIFDRHLTWHKHISYLHTRCSKDLQLLRAVSHGRYGADYSILRRLYEAIILPKLDYGCFLYASASNSNLLILDRIQYAATRILLGALRCTATYKLEAETLIMPLHIRRRQFLLQYGCRILSIPHHPARKLILHPPPVHYLRGTYTLPALLRLAGEFQFAHLDPHHVPLIPLHVQYRTNSLPAFSSLASHPKDTYTSSQWLQAFKHLHSTSYHAHTPLYTDGSKSDTHCGCALWSDPFTLLARLPPSLSAFTAELYAIYIGLRFLHKHRPPGPFVLYTDSLSAIQALQTLHRHSHHLLYSIAELLSALPPLYVILEWVPGHMGIPGNTKADSSAKSSYLLHSISSVFPSAFELRSLVRDQYFQLWSRQWSDHPESLRAFKPTLCPTVPQDVSRPCQVSITRLRLGTSLLTHIHLFHGQVPVCQHCKCLNSPEHLLLHCPAHLAHRVPLQRTCTSLGIPFTVPALLSPNFPASILTSYLLHSASLRLL